MWALALLLASAPVEQITTTPGLTEEQVAPVLAAGRAALADCINLEAPDDAKDDRLLVRFNVERDGAVEKDSVDVWSVFLDDQCVREHVRDWKFPRVPVLDRVNVTWLIHFLVTPAERKKLRDKQIGEMRAYCDELTRLLPKAKDVHAAVVEAAVRLAEKPLSRGGMNWVGGLAGIPLPVGTKDADFQIEIFDGVAKEIAPWNCPAVEVLRKVSAQEKR